MALEAPHALIPHRRTISLTRMDAVRVLLGGAALALGAVGLPGDISSSRKSRKVSKKRKARRNRSDTTPADDTAPAPAPDEGSRDLVVIQDPCEAFSDASCKDSAT
jgi:hypothetical protein